QLRRRPARPDGHTYFVGSANGGVWKTTDGGNDWTPLTDYVTDSGGNPVPVSIGALAAFAPNNPQPTDPLTPYAATGLADLVIDPFSPEDIYIGLGNMGLVTGSTAAGLWKSPNHGGSWNQTLGGVTPGVPNNTIPSGSNVGRVTLALGTGRPGDEAYIYALIA